MSLSPGSKLGPYEILAPLGAGGMGEVWKARDTRLDRFVAVKVLPEHLLADPELRARFEREAKAVAALNHPNILGIYEFSQDGALAFAAMELLEGESLRARLGQGPLPPRKAVELAMQMARGLAAAHEKGVIHRDLKPDNLWIGRDGRLKILDFGLAKQAEAPKAHAQSLIETAVAHTGEGTILGTVGYMSPEQVRGEPVDARSDIFSLGTVLYEMLTGHRAFRGASSADTLAAILREEPPELGDGGRNLPPGLERVLRHCLEKDPAHRFQGANDLAFALESLGGSGSAAPLGAPFEPRKRRATVAWGVLAALVIAGSGLLGWGLGRKGALPGPPPRSGPPVIVLMDSTHPQRVYDDDTRKAGGTNADDLTDLLRDLPVSLVKENTNVLWHRETQVLKEKPDLIVIHRSCFFDATFLPDAGLSDRTYPFASDKFELFAGFIGSNLPNARFLVYSRRSWKDEGEVSRWISDLENRFPALKGRVRAWPVPLERTSFRDARTGAEIKALIRELLPPK